MAIWTEIVREAEAADPWTQSARARGDLPLCLRRYLEAGRDVRHWRGQVRDSLFRLRRIGAPPAARLPAAAPAVTPAGVTPPGAPAPDLSIAWTHYRDAQRRLRLWRQATTENADYAALLLGTVALPLDRVFRALEEDGPERRG